VPTSQLEVHFCFPNKSLFTILLFLWFFCCSWDSILITHVECKDQGTSRTLQPLATFWCHYSGLLKCLAMFLPLCWSEDLLLISLSTFFQVMSCFFPYVHLVATKCHTFLVFGMVMVMGFQHLLKPSSCTMCQCFADFMGYDPFPT
jgi:hypothetical protein